MDQSGIWGSNKKNTATKYFLKKCVKYSLQHIKFLYFGLLFLFYKRVLIIPVNLFLGILFCVFNSKMALTLHMMKTVVATWPQMRTNIKKKRVMVHRNSRLKTQFIWFHFIKIIFFNTKVWYFFFLHFISIFR